MYDGRDVAHPLQFQLRTTVLELSKAQQPMTFLFAYDPFAENAAATRTVALLDRVTREFVTVHRPN